MGFLPRKKRGGRLDSNFFGVYFFLSSRNATTAIAAIIAIVDPAMYVSVGGAGVGSGAGVG